MNRGSHTSSKVSGTRMNVSIFGIQTEVPVSFLFDRVLNCLDSPCKPFKDSLDIPTLFHWNDSQLVFLIDPDQESFGIIVEDSSPLRPIPLHSSHSQISVSGYKQEMVIHKLLPDSFIHSSKRIVFASKVSFKSSSSILHQIFHTKSLFLCDARRKAKSINGTSNTDSCRVNRNIRFYVALNFRCIHVRNMKRVIRDSMVLLYNWIKNWSKVFVGIPVTSIDTTVLIIKLNSTSYGLNQCKTWGLCLNTFQLFPFLLSDMLGNKGMFRLNIWERSICFCWHSFVCAFLFFL